MNKSKLIGFILIQEHARYITENDLIKAFFSIFVNKTITAKQLKTGKDIHENYNVEIFFALTGQRNGNHILQIEISLIKDKKILYNH